MILFWALLIAFVTVGLCVIVHYEALRLTSLLIPRLTIPPRPKVLVVIAAVFLAHLAEIIIFAVTYRLMQPFPQLGEIAGLAQGAEPRHPASARQQDQPAGRGLQLSRRAEEARCRGAEEAT
ncbi:MAG: hypothetical protein LKM31_11475 [Sphingobium sp.]|jgi:hypothetical protein|nr:hypothetical protein [Sphingobium sp.]